MSTREKAQALLKGIFLTLKTARPGQTKEKRSVLRTIVKALNVSKACAREGKKADEFGQMFGSFLRKISERVCARNDLEECETFARWCLAVMEAYGCCSENDADGTSRITFVLDDARKARART